MVFDNATHPGVAPTFSGLSNGVGYTFEAEATNACGSGGIEGSPTYTPGIPPAWERNTPPLHAAAGQYVYKFSASGDPSPTYRLTDAPAWLSITATGLVSGRPPADTTSFSYSVIATNRVGILWVSQIVAGPFTVGVRSP